MRLLPGKKGFSTGGFRLILATYLAFPVLSLVVAHYGLSVPAGGIVRILLSPLFYFSGALAVMAALGLARLQRWGWICFKFSNFLLVYQTAFWIANFSSGDTRFLIFSVAVSVIAALYWRVRYEVRRPYFLPRIRWWELGSPSFCSLEARLGDEKGREGDGEVLDLTVHGCFVKTPFEVELGSVLQVRFSIEQKPVEVRGTVVWRAQSAVTHPRGLGVRFRSLDRSIKKSLKGVPHELGRDGTSYAARRSGSLGA